LKAIASSELHFNIGNLDSLTINNVDIQTTIKSTIPPLIIYSSQFWADHLVYVPDKKLIEAVKFMIYEKLLFWKEIMDKVYKVSLILKKALIMEGVSLGHFSVIHLMSTGQSLSSDNELTLFICDIL